MQNRVDQSVVGVLVASERVIGAGTVAERYICSGVLQRARALANQQGREFASTHQAKAMGEEMKDRVTLVTGCLLYTSRCV